MLLIASRARSSVTQRTVLRTQQNPVPNIFPQFRILTMLEGFNIQHGSWPSPKGNKKLISGSEYQITKLYPNQNISCLTVNNQVSAIGKHNITRYSLTAKQKTADPIPRARGWGRGVRIRGYGG